MPQDKPLQYFVVRSPFAQLIVTGVKKFEFRTNAKTFANKRLAVAISQYNATDSDLEKEFEYWQKQLTKSIKKQSASEQESAQETFQKACRKAKALFGKTNGSGMIIGEVETGDAMEFDGDFGVHILNFKLWPESEWMKSPGGLGIRYMPGVEHETREVKMDYSNAYKSTFTRILDKYRQDSVSQKQKGYKFELLMQRYLQTDPIFANSLSNVWLWEEFFAKDQFGGKDVGIDLVAETTGGNFWAIQCKCYKAGTIIDKPAVDTFLATSGKIFKDKDGNKVHFAYRLWLDTTEHGFNREALNSLENQDPEFHRIGLLELENSMVDWERLDKGSCGENAQVQKKKPRDHQKEAIAKVHEYFKDESHERGKLIMACGTGKTYTSLCIAEKETDNKGTILFLVPSIALLGQTLREWTADATKPIKPICICSDTGVSKKVHISGENEGDGYSITSLALPASTDVNSIVKQLEIARYKKGGMTVVFSTYQSIDVISKAQKKMGASFQFDMIICDEAHRTTGATQLGAEASNFVKVHDPEFLRAKKRVYMTATPRLYSESSKKKAEEGSVEICSMDDPKLYGEEMYRIGFGDAVNKELLSDYKVLVLTIDPLAMSESLQLSLATKTGEMLTDDEAKLIGCFNALSKITLVDDRQLKDTDPQPMKRAVAFSQNIKVSKEIVSQINELKDSYYEALKPEAQKQTVRVSAMHIDGSMGATQREERLAWLKAGIEDGQCRILNNVRCLSEGVDVPSLDAVLFLSARDSEVDVVQSVGRVMRTAPGKKYGYIIIPVIVPSNEKPEETLNNNERFKVVWKILNALRAHDDRFNAMVNKIQFNTPQKGKSVTGGRIGVASGLPGSDVENLTPEQRKVQEELLGQIEMRFQELQGAIYAKMVEKVGSRRYWEDWAKDVADIAKRHEDRIRKLIAVDGKPKAQFEKFLAALKKNLNPGVNEEQAIEMLSQHLITKPVFEALFEDYDFAKNNPVSRALQRVINAVESTTDDVDKSSLEKFYQSVKLRAEGVESAEGKQKIIIELYDKFFKSALPKTVEKLGIVYTPVECVDFILHSVDDVLKLEFGRRLTDENVNIIDPFAGTGTFMTRLIQSGLINKKDLERKFKKELKTNEIVLLAYYIASVNIENAYHDVMGSEEYTPFEGICLTDSFQLGEHDYQEDLNDDVFPVNGPRARAQKRVPIQVVIGNPPYSVGQKSANDNAQNQKYPDLDKRIEDFYVATSEANLNKAAYDSYIKAFRWATDRLDPKNGGIIGFITNGSWLDSNGLDGFRKCLEKEFSKIFVFNLRGNQRTSGELSRKEGGKIFGSGSRTPVSITILVKRPTPTSLRGATGDEAIQKAVIKYYDIGDYLSREDKLKIVKDAESIMHLEMSVLHPNENGDWINQRNENFGKWTPIEPDKKFDVISKSWFNTFAIGVSTNRDAWVYGFSKENVSEKMQNMISFYNSETKKLKNGEIRLPSLSAAHISWTVNLKKDAEKGVLHRFEKASFIESCYRPYCRQYLYYDKPFIERPGLWSQLFPTPENGNLVIMISGIGANKPFTALISDRIPSLDTVEKNQCFPLYYYEKPNGNDLFGDYVRKDAISDYILKQARTQYSDPKIRKEDIFYYVYGFLHSEEYRTEFAADLKKMLPRIPLVDTADDFWAFSKAGRRLADIHLNYEQAEPYKALIVSSNQVASELPMFSGMAAEQRAFFSAEDPKTLYKVRQMRFAKKSGYDSKGKAKNVDDKTRIIYNEKISIAGIPEKAYEYVVNGKSAIEWIMERYAITTDKASGIVNDPNDWALEHNDPKYIFNLVLRIITVSLETMKIVKSLPKVKF